MEPKNWLLNAVSTVEISAQSQQQCEEINGLYLPAGATSSPRTGGQEITTFLLYNQATWLPGKMASKVAFVIYNQFSNQNGNY